MPDPFIIAEVGIAHGGSLDRALSLVETTARAGANAFKTQFWSSTAAMRKRMHNEDDPADLDPLRTREEWLSILRDAAHAKGMEFLCTVDCFEDIAVVAPYVDRFKIASWGWNDTAFIDAHRAYGKPLIISLGAFPQEEWDRIVSCSDRHPWISNIETWLLHCVSAYPAPITEINLRVLHHKAWQTDTYMFHGFSDHTGKTITGALAVAAGARVLEVHVRAADTPADNPEFPHSLTPEDFKTYAGLARLAARALGDGVKRMMPSEEKNVRFRYIQLPH